jgi:hypothetical protein
MGWGLSWWHGGRHYLRPAETGYLEETITGSLEQFLLALFVGAFKYVRRNDRRKVGGVGPIAKIEANRCTRDKLDDWPLATSINFPFQHGSSHDCWHDPLPVGLVSEMTVCTIRLSRPQAQRVTRAGVCMRL